MDTTLSPLLGQLLDGRYRVESRISAGGMATVFLARDTRLDRVVALKVADPQYAGDAEFVSRFIGEARAVAKLSSPNVVAIYDHGSADGGLHYIAMEHVPGQSLRGLLTSRGALDPTAALDIICGVLAGLAAAHRAGIVHRDVKPENVLLGVDGTVKVVDFGLARAVSGSARTRTGQLVGTAAYLAPELVTGEGCDARSDVYATGIMLFELLTGMQPFRDDTPLAVAYQHVTGRVPAPSSIRPQLPASADALVALATSRDPGLRPADAGQYLDAVVAMRRGATAYEVPSAGWSGTSTPAGGVEHRTSVLPIPVSADPLPTRQPGGPATRSAHTRPRRAARASTEPFLQRWLFSRRLGYLAAGLAVALALGLGTWWLAVGRYRTVPQLRGDAVTAARARLSALGLTVRPGRSEHSSISAGRVINTMPGAGSRVATGSTVVLVASLGPVMVTMPSVTGYPVGQAEQLLRSAGLRVGRVLSQPSATIPSGVVVGTDPVAGSRWPKGRPVRLTVSAGPPLPDLSGMPLQQAEQIAQQGGFAIQPIGSAAPNALITRQSPAAGTAIQPHEVVTVWASAGVQVPNVSLMPVQAAIQTLQQAGFKVTVNRQGPGNFVTSYSPSGSQLPGTTITLNVGLGFP